MYCEATVRHKVVMMYIYSLLKRSAALHLARTHLTSMFDVARALTICLRGL